MPPPCCMPPPIMPMPPPCCTPPPIMPIPPICAAACGGPELRESPKTDVPAFGFSGALVPPPRERLSKLIERPPVPLDHVLLLGAATFGAAVEEGPSKEAPIRFAAAIGAAAAGAGVIIPEPIPMAPPPCIIPPSIPPPPPPPPCIPIPIKPPPVCGILNPPPNKLATGAAAGAGAAANAPKSLAGAAVFASSSMRAQRVRRGSVLGVGGCYYL